MKRAIAMALAALSIAAAPVSIELPFSAALYPDLGAGAPPTDAVNNNCLSCHSVEMVMTQPRLTKAEWAAEVTKMRTVFKAPVDPADDAAIIAWLTAMSAKLPDKPG